MNDFDVAVLALIAEGRTRSDVAAQLDTTTGVVKHRLRAIRRDLQAVTTIQAAATWLDAA